MACLHEPVFFLQPTYPLLSPPHLHPPRPQISIPQGHGDLCDIPHDLVFPLGALKFRGVPVSAPGDIHGTLSYRYGPDYMIPKYMDKGRDHVEQGKFYARLLGLLGKAGLRV